MEFGANTGMNKHALRRLLPDVELAVIELNPDAAPKLAKIKGWPCIWARPWSLGWTVFQTLL